MKFFMVITALIAIMAVVIALAAFQSIDNWEQQLRHEFSALEIRVNNLMEAIRLLNKKIETLEAKKTKKVLKQAIRLLNKKIETLEAKKTKKVLKQDNTEK